MDKKTTIEIVIALVFFGMSAYIFMNYEDLSLLDFSGNKTASQISNETDVKIEEMLGRKFIIGENTVLNDEKFLNLKETSVFAPKVEDLDIGKKNPFETRQKK